MATRRRSRRKSISGNLTDIQKRIRYLETRPAAGRLASKAVATKNLALRAVDEETVADNAIVRRSIANSAVGTAQIEQGNITKALMATDSVGTAQLEQDSVTANEIAPGTITVNEMGADSVSSTQIVNGSVGTNELAGDIPDSKISGISASKLIGQITTDKIGDSQVTDGKIAGISGSKIIGGIDGALIVNGSVTEGKIASLPTTKLTGTITNDQLAGSIQAIKIAGVNSSVLIGEVAANNIANLPASKITSGTFATDRIPTLSASKVSGLSNAFTTMSVAGIGISRSLEVNGDYRRFDITISAGSGSNQLAIGSHTHPAGTTVPNHTHTVQGASYVINNSGPHGHTGQNGSHTHGVNIPTITTSNPSTLRLKKEIQDHAFDPKLLLKLNLKKYKYKNEVRYLQDSLHREWMYGYIAEEVQESGLEEILGYDREGKVDSIQYGVLATLAIELIKQQQNDIDSLKEEIQRLKEKI